MSSNKVAKKGRYVPVKNLNPEQLAERRADELRRKQSQRARKAGKTVDEYRDNIVARNTARRERQEANLWEREIQANERKIRRNEVAKLDERDDPHDNETWNKSLWSKRSKNKDLQLPGIGTKLKKIRKKLRTQLRDIQKKQKWFNPGTTSKPMPLESKKIYGMFDDRMHQWEIDGSGHKDPETFLELCLSSVKKLIDSVEGNKKTHFKLDVLLVRPNLQTGEEELDNSGFRSDTYETTASDDIEEIWPEIMTTILTRLSKFQQNGSGWVLRRMNKLIINADVYDPIAGNSFIELPLGIKLRKAVINIKNGDNNCFPLSVAVSQVYAEDPTTKNLERPTNKKVLDKLSQLNMKDITLPMKLKDIDKFEKNNPGLNIMVFGLNEDEKISHLRIKRRPNKDLANIRLLMWSNTDGTSHYSPITNLSRLLSKQISNHKTPKFFCDNCGNPFSSEEVLSKHEEMCYTNECQKIIYTNKYIKFDKWRSSQHIPFAVFFDIESYNKKPSDPAEFGHTVRLSEQTPSGLGYLIVGPEGFEPSYKQFDTVSSCITSMMGDLKEIYSDWFKDDKPITMTEEDTTKYNNTDKCYVCGWHLVQGENKVRDHDHFTGKFRGAACKRCNLDMKKPRFVPVYAHNLEGYDSHLIINEVAKHGRLTCIPHTKESYTSFSLFLKEGFGADRSFEVRFLDSFKFLGKGLASMVKTLSTEDFILTRKLMPDVSDEQFELLQRKGVYPYSWVDGPSKMKSTELPPIEAFYNDLSESECSVEDYEHAQRVWKAFGMKTFQEYQDTYLKSDVLQLADIFEKFRKTSHETYGLDPAWDYTRSGFAWKSMFKMTEVSLKTIGDPNIFMFFESALRGGISVITKRHSVANHKYIRNHDPEKPSKFIIDNDMNNLYGGPESDLLPTDGFAWMSDEQLDNWDKFPEKTGCFLEVDLVVPKHLHDHFNDYPLACERMPVGKTTKLVPNLNDKKNYVIHYEELKHVVKHGLLLTKVHRGVKFNQSRWMKPFIDLNTKLRTESTTDFGKDFFKGMNLSVYGKTCENKRKWCDVKLISKGEKNASKRANKYISRPNYKGGKQFSSTLMALELSHGTTLMDKPIYVGATILAKSKVMMSEFWYEYVKPKWGKNARLLFTDTDSLCMEITTDDYYKDISPDIHKWFDTSNYPGPHMAKNPDHEPEDLIPHPSGIPTNINKKVIGKMKDECGGKNIERYAGNCPKVYAIKMEDGSETKRLKGVKRYVIAGMEYQEFEDCVLRERPTTIQQNTIRSRDHKICVERMTKKALTPGDNKRIIHPNNIDTLAIGHWRHLPKLGTVVDYDIQPPDAHDNLRNMILNRFG